MHILSRLEGGLGGPGRPLGDVRGLPEQGQGNFKFIEKQWVFIAFPSLEVSRKLSRGVLDSVGGGLLVVLISVVVDANELLSCSGPGFVRPSQ